MTTFCAGRETKAGGGFRKLLKVPVGRKQNTETGLMPKWVRPLGPLLSTEPAHGAL